MRRSLEFSSRKKNLEGIKEEPQKSYEEHMRDLKALLDFLPKEVDEEISAAVEKIKEPNKRDQDVAAAREAVMSTFRKSSPEASHRSRPLDMPRDLEGTSTRRLFTSKDDEPQEPDPEPTSEFEPLKPSDLAMPISEPDPEPIEFKQPESFNAPFPSELEVKSEPEPTPTQEPAPEFEPLEASDVPITVSEPDPEPEHEQPEFQPESAETFKFEERKALNTLKEIYAKIANATPGQVREFKLLYDALSDLSKSLPTSEEEEHQKLTRLFDIRDEINELNSEIESTPV